MAKAHIFEHPELFQVLPWREWIRRTMPGSAEGFVFEDLDLVVRRFDRDDPLGRFMFVEMKYGTASLDTAQQWTFGLIDGLLRRADPRRTRYIGYYLLQYPQKDPEKCRFVLVNGRRLWISYFKRWLAFEHHIEPMRFVLPSEMLEAAQL